MNLKKTFDNPNEVLKAFAKKLIKRGYDVSSAKELGAGYNGTAYSINSGKQVLKITIDESEAKAATHLKGKKSKHIIHIYDTFRFGKYDWYGIIEDFAEELSNDEKMYFDMYIKLFLNNMYTDRTEVLTTPWKLSWKEIKARVTNNTQWDPEEKKTAEEGFLFLEKLEFDKLLKELNDNKVEYYDVHSANFMKRSGVLVLVDLGGDSQSPGKIPAELKENNMKITKEFLRNLIKEELEKEAFKPTIIQGGNQGDGKRIGSLRTAFAGPLQANDKNPPILIGKMQEYMHGEKRYIYKIAYYFGTHKPAEQYNFFAVFKESDLKNTSPEPTGEKFSISQYGEEAALQMAKNCARTNHPDISYKSSKQEIEAILNKRSANKRFNPRMGIHYDNN